MTPVTNSCSGVKVTPNTKTNAEKDQLFAESVEQNFGIESYLFSKFLFDWINELVEGDPYHFITLQSLNDNVGHVDDHTNLELMLIQAPLFL